MAAADSETGTKTEDPVRGEKSPADLMTLEELLAATRDRSTERCALAAIGFYALGDDDRMLTMFDALLVDVELLRYALGNCVGKEDNIVRLAESYVWRLLDRIRALRAVHIGGPSLLRTIEQAYERDARPAEKIEEQNGAQSIAP